MQKLENDLESSHVKEKTLDEQINQLQNEIVVVQQKIKEVEDDRNENYHAISNHHQVTKLEKEKNELMEKYNNLFSLYTKTNQQLRELKEKFESSKNLGITLESNLAAVSENLTEEKSKRHELEQKLNKKFKEQIHNLKRKIKELTELSEAERDDLNRKIADLESKLDAAIIANERYEETITDLERKLKKTATSLEQTVKLLPEAEQKKNNLLVKIKNLQQVNLTAKKLSRQKTSRLQKRIVGLTKLSVQKKKDLEWQIHNLEVKLIKKAEIEKTYQTRIQKLEENLTKTTNELRIIFQTRIKEKPLMDGLKKEIKKIV